MIILLCGEYKCGKTVSAATFPKPMLYLDFDNGFKSITTTTNKDGDMIVPDHAQIQVETFLRKGAHALDFTIDRKAKVAPAYTSYAQPLITKLNKILTQLHKDQKYDGKGPYKTLVIDSLTSMFRVWEDMVVNADSVPILQVQNYMTLQVVLFKQFFPMLKALGLDYIILIDHVQMEKDEISQRIMEFPIGPSKAMGKLMGMEFDEIWYQTGASDKYQWWTKRKGLFQAGSRLNLPNPMEATYQALKEYLK